MGKASRTKVEANRREKIAAQRAAERRTEQRRRILLVSGCVLVVVAVVVAFIIVKVSSGPAKSTASPNGPTGAALASVIKDVTTVPASTLDKVGDGGGSVEAKPKAISGTSLTSNGKPEVLYMGAEYCPYCAAERWAVIVALSRFGTISGLSTIHSASVNGAGQAEPYPNTPTWTFVKSKFTSPYFTFTPVEMETNIPDKSTGEYTTLQNPTAAQTALINKYSTDGSIPFIYFDGKAVISGASYNAGVLSGLSWATIASDLHNPSSSVAKAVLGTANYITAAICKTTNNAPASACTPTVKSLQSQI
jgi:thiol-disulfide isomerase/thioredoxin